MVNTPPFPLHDLPPGLEHLAILAADLRWTWSHDGDALWKSLAPEIWSQTENPYVVLQNTPRERLQALVNDSQFQGLLQRLIRAHNAYYDQPCWFDQTYLQKPIKGIAYFSMEFGLGEALPLYAGGLGILTGDYLKAASDLGLPLVGIGLLYQEGYFRQTLDSNGWQQETYYYNDPMSIPVRPLLKKNGVWMHVISNFPNRRVCFRVWQAQVGKVTLYLLDSNDPLNLPGDRGITSKLYGVGEELRLMQEIALGICGWRLIDALAIDIDICHLNEGHAAFATLERARLYSDKCQCDFWQALWATRAGNIFTTHTPVTAGFDRYHPSLLQRYGREFADNLGVDVEQLAALGRENSGDPNEPFNMAYLAMRTCARANGVSRLHGSVSQRIFNCLYPRWPQSQVPVTHITNGIHVPSWDSPWADKEWTRMAGKERWRGDVSDLDISLQTEMSDEALWAVNGRERADLVEYARTRLARQAVTGELNQSASLALDPNILTLGFARRFADYKRPDLLLHDEERFARLLNHPERPVQIIVAGKAHPADEVGKRALQHWLQFVRRHDVRTRAVFLEDYNIPLAQHLVQGVDLWINTPRRPWEACGTSGMKVLVNGGLNISELDGWWAEAYSPEVGWALGDGREHSGAEGNRDWDAATALQLYAILEQEVVPLFYQRDVSGLPRQWIQRMRASMSLLTPEYSANRMLRDYLDVMYLPAAKGLAERCNNDGACARDLHAWSQKLRRYWHEIHMGDLHIKRLDKGWRFEVAMYLGEVTLQDLSIELFAETANASSEPFCQPMQTYAGIEGGINSYCFTAVVETDRPASDFTPRVIPAHPQALVPMENNLIIWWSGQRYFA